MFPGSDSTGLICPCRFDLLGFKVPPHTGSLRLQESHSPGARAWRSLAGRGTIKFRGERVKESTPAPHSLWAPQCTRK